MRLKVLKNELCALYLHSRMAPTIPINPLNSANTTQILSLSMKANIEFVLGGKVSMRIFLHDLAAKKHLEIYFLTKLSVCFEKMSLCKG